MLGAALVVSRYLAFRSLALAAMAMVHQGPAPGAPIIADAIGITVARDCTGTGVLGSCELDTITLAVLAEAEGHLCLVTDCKRGDHGQSVSTWQLLTPDPRRARLYELDVYSAAERAYDVLRWSARICPRSPLAGYCGGCSRRGARALAEPRQRTARALYAILQAQEDPVALAELP